MRTTGSPLDSSGVFCELKLFLKVEIKGAKYRVLCRFKTKVVPLLQVPCDKELLFFFFLYRESLFGSVLHGSFISEED